MPRILIILFLLIPIVVSSQFKIKTYSVGEGLAQSQVYAMLEDSRGYIWMGTQGGGISRFDGKNFENFSTKDGLINNYIYSIHEDASGNIWIGTNDGISIFNGISFKNIKINNLANLMIGCFVEDQYGTLWIGTAKGIYQYRTGEFTHWSHEQKIFKRYIYDLYEHVDGAIWACSDDGVLRIKGNDVRAYSVRDGLSNKSTRGIDGDKSGIYISTYGGGLNKFDGSDFSVIETGVNAIHDLLLVNDGVWVS
ncbi:MAG: hypothetical protein JKY54_01225, partial [Flavobacteriales bacterium]|nr:hypothetical protein [Flavobacteriales bacterium]